MELETVSQPINCNLCYVTFVTLSNRGYLLPLTPSLLCTEILLVLPRCLQFFTFAHEFAERPQNRT